MNKQLTINKEQLTIVTEKAMGAGVKRKGREEIARIARFYSIDKETKLDLLCVSVVQAVPFWFHIGELKFPV